MCQCAYNFLLISLSLSHNPFILEGNSIFPIAEEKNYFHWRAWLQQMCVCAWCSNWFPSLAGWDLCQGWLAVLYIRSLREQPNLHNMKLISRFPAPPSAFNKHSAPCHMTSDWPHIGEAFQLHLILWYSLRMIFVFFYQIYYEHLKQFWDINPYMSHVNSVVDIGRHLNMFCTMFEQHLDTHQCSNPSLPRGACAFNLSVVTECSSHQTQQSFPALSIKNTHTQTPQAPVMSLSSYVSITAIWLKDLQAPVMNRQVNHNNSRKKDLLTVMGSWPGFSLKRVQHRRSMTFSKNGV